MAETSSEQWLVPPASDQQKGVDDRMHWVIEKNLWRRAITFEKGSMGLPTPQQWEEYWHTTFLLLCSL